MRNLTFDKHTAILIDKSDHNKANSHVDIVMENKNMM